MLENIAFPLRELKVLPPDVIREAAMVKLQMVGPDIPLIPILRDWL